MSSFLLSSFVLSCSPSLLPNAMAVAFFVVHSLVGVSEAAGGSHLRYSKFAGAAASPGKFFLFGLGAGRRVPSRVGMVAVYAPALAAALAAFWLPGIAETPRGVLVTAALALHFLKRVLESLFVHNYSGHMAVDTMIVISAGYFTTAAFIIYAQHLCRGAPEPGVDLQHPGIALFLVGVCGNFYHHLLLSKLRKKGEKGYKIPEGGLFGLVVCPHYLFEIVGLLGISFISQTLNSYAFALASAMYLTGRSYSTREWYRSKFDNFPREIKALIPYVF